MPSGVRIRALTDDAKLLNLRVNQVYENQTAGQIVSDLARLREALSR